jgi:hypothetical protein
MAPNLIKKKKKVPAVRPLTEKEAIEFLNLDMSKHENDPFIVKKAEDARAALIRGGFLKA